MTGRESALPPDVREMVERYRASAAETRAKASLIEGDPGIFPPIIDDMRRIADDLDYATAMLERLALQTAAASDVLAERKRHTEVEGWTPEHDDAHDDGSMALAAAGYAIGPRTTDGEPPEVWPWGHEWWKPKDRRRDLVRAGALIIAEIERLDRLLPTPPKEGETDGQG